MNLQTFFDRELDVIAADPACPEAHAELLVALEAGEIRAAEPVGGPHGQALRGREAGVEGGTSLAPQAGGPPFQAVVWRVNAWVKRGILAGFRISAVAPQPGGFFDKTAYPARRFALEDGVRVVPGGTSVRRGAFIARGAVLMPPAYVNVGAYVGEGTMVDSHALVGSCAQIGARVHLSAAAQIGGVLEPAGARPVIVEDEAFVGGLVGVFEGVRIGRRAVLASGVVLNGSTVIHDLVQGRTWQGEVPAGAVVVPGSRPAKGAYAEAQGIHLATPVIVKYRDDRTDAATALETALR